MLHLTTEQHATLNRMATRGNYLDTNPNDRLIAKILLDNSSVKGQTVDIKGILQQVLNFLSRTDIPGTQIDDAIREILQWFLGRQVDSPTLAYFAAKVDIPPGALSVEAENELPGDVKEELASAPFSIDDLLRYLPALIAFFNWFRGRDK